MYEIKEENMNIQKQIEKLIALANNESFDENGISEDFVEALNGMEEFSNEEKVLVKVAVSKQIVDVDSIFGASILAIWLGGAVENGDNSDLYIDPILEKFLSIAKSLNLPISDEENEFDYDGFSDSMDAGLVQGLQYFGQSLVAQMARNPKRHKEIQNDKETIQIIEALIPVSYGAVWIDELLQKVSNDLVIVHAEKHMAVRVRYKNLSNCFHLFTLLQEALVDVMPNSSKIEDKELLLFAKGLNADLEKASDKAWWHYGEATCNHANINASILGEMTPHAISTIDNEQVILLWSSIFSNRTWSSSFFTPFLEAAPPSVELIEVLNEEDTQVYLKKCGI